MKITDILLIVLALAWIPQPTSAQESTQEAAKDTTGILRAIVLPTISEILREQGVPAEEVQETIIGARDKGIPADETAVILEEAARGVEEHGPIENFGAFVQARLDAGLRGRDLAAAIRAEHARRGIGKGNRIEPRGRGQGQGRSGQAGRGQGQGGPDAADRGQGGSDAADTAAGPSGRDRPEAADSAARRGPPEGRGQGAKRPDSVPDSTQRRRGGGNGGGA